MVRPGPTNVANGHATDLPGVVPRRSQPDGRAARNVIPARPGSDARRPAHVVFVSVPAYRAHVPDTDPELIRLRLEQRARAGANGFCWIAALSLVNSLSLALGTTWGFVAGLGVTRVFDGFLREVGPLGRTVNVLLDIGAAGAFISLGDAARCHRNGFLVGLGPYAADTLVFLAVQEWTGVGFPLFVPWSISLGSSAFQRLSADGPETPASPPFLAAGVKAASHLESLVPELVGPGRTASCPAGVLYRAPGEDARTRRGSSTAAERVVWR